MQHGTHRIGTMPGLAMEVAGQGQPLVFLHGIGGNRTNWHGQLGHFADRYLAASFDLGGYGDSGDLPDGFSFFDFVDHLRQVLDALGAERAHLVGLSMGGLVAQAFYAASPRRVASLTLAGSRPGSAPVHPGEQGRAFLEARLRPLEEGLPIAALADRLAPTLVSASADAASRAAVHASLAALRPCNFIKVMRSRTALEPFLDLAAIDVPTLVIAGEADQVAPLAQMRQMAAEIPGSRFVCLPAAGHLMNMECPEAFNRALAEFLGSLDRGQ